VSLTTGSGTLSGQLVSGPMVRLFSPTNVTYDVAESITLDITAPGLAGISGIPVTIEPVGTVADHLAFGTAPRATEVVGEDWEPFTVRVEDAGGALVPEATGIVSLTRTSGSGTITNAIAALDRG